MNALAESIVIAISSGVLHTVIVERTTNEFKSRTEMVPSPRLATIAILPSGDTRTSPGWFPTRTVEITLRLSKSITETLDDPELATKARLASGERSMK